MSEALARLLVCPRCRHRDAAHGELQVHTVALGPSHAECTGCGATYPVVDGIPLLVPSPAGLLRGDGLCHFNGLSPEAALPLLVGATDADPWVRHLEWRSMWLHAHWADTLERPEVPGFAPFAARLAALPPVPATVELGCSFGRGLSALRGDLVVGVDLAVDALRAAQGLLQGRPLRFGLRALGREYALRELRPPARATPPQLVVGDVLDPPLVPGAFDRVVALNVLDAVSDPATLLAVMDGLCRPGGELIIASPFAWQSAVTDDALRPTGDPLAWLAAQLGAGYALDPAVSVPWALRRDARCELRYDAVWLRAVKRG